MATNPLFNVLNGGQQPANSGIPNFMADFQRLQQTVNNPRQEVERLLQSGAMSQQDFNKYSQIANHIINSGVFK